MRARRPRLATRPMRRARCAALVVATLATSTLALGSGDPVGALDGYVPLASPRRLVDTRPGEPTADGRFAGIGIRPRDGTLRLDVAGRVGLGDDPGTVVINITVDQPQVAGFVTAWPCDEPRPTTSNLNYVAGQTVAVAALARVADDGTVCFFTLTRTHLIVDAAGSFPAGSFEALDRPERLADTRPGGPTIDGEFAGDGPLGDEGTYRVAVAGRGGVPPDATTAVLNVTATEVTAPGFLTVYPCDEPRPTASNVNYRPGLTTPNLVVTPLSADGDVCVFTLATVDLVVDVTGTFPAGVFTPLPGSRRLLDTRASEPTFDGRFRGGGRQMDRSTLQLDVAGRAGVPSDAAAVVLNVTSTGTAQPGFVTVHPQGTTQPGSSNVNLVAGRDVANLVVASLGPAGDVCLYNQGATDLVVDVAGWIATDAPAAATAPASCPERSVGVDVADVRDAHLRRPGLHRVVGSDRIAVYICDVPANSTRFDGSRQHDVTPEQFAEFAATGASPWFTTTSQGRYATEFVPNGRIPLGRDDGADECLDAATSRSGGSFTNAMAATSTSDVGGGFAGAGSIMIGPGAVDEAVLERPPNTSGRGIWIGGAEISRLPDPSIVVHEIGHTLHWPHSFVGPGTEYDNPVDVMSDGAGPCRIGNITYRCTPGNTLAFNRFAADWLTDGQVDVHASGTANHLLAAPGDDGLQLLLAPDPAQPLSALTLETRVATGFDDFIEVEGVAIHVVDQLNRTGGSGLGGLSTARFTRQARGAGGTYDHVVRLGETVRVHGVGISVLERVGDAFVVRVTGNYRMPAGAFFAESVSFDRTSCATLDLDAALAGGCLR